MANNQRWVTHCCCCWRLRRATRRVDFWVAAGYCSIDRLHNEPNMRPKTWPLLKTENYDCDFAGGKILLIEHVLVGREQNVEAILVRGHEQFAILKLVRALLRSCANLMSFE